MLKRESLEEKNQKERKRAKNPIYDKRKKKKKKKKEIKSK